MTRHPSRWHMLMHEEMLAKDREKVASLPRLGYLVASFSATRLLPDRIQTFELWTGLMSPIIYPSISSKNIRGERGSNLLSSTIPSSQSLCPLPQSTEHPVTIREVSRQRA